MGKTQAVTRPVSSTLIRVDDPYRSFAALLELYASARQEKTGREEPVSIAPSAKLGEDLFIGAFSCIAENASTGNRVKIHRQVYIGENVSIGDRTVLYPGVKIYRDCVVGADCVLHAGAVADADCKFA
ncbi:MAG: hypothetical protein LBR10_02130 [Prevotellaceae bacterium]|nr:hypothetical protein [Prevotellaceae bacterium]